MSDPDRYRLARRKSPEKLSMDSKRQRFRCCAAHGSRWAPRTGASKFPRDFSCVRCGRAPRSCTWARERTERVGRCPLFFSKGGLPPALCSWRPRHSLSCLERRLCRYCPSSARRGLALGRSHPLLWREQPPDHLHRAAHAGDERAPVEAGGLVAVDAEDLHPALRP